MLVELKLSRKYGHLREPSPPFHPARTEETNLRWRRGWGEG